MFKHFFQRLKKSPAKTTAALPPTAKVILTQACLRAIKQCLLHDTQRKHEGITYLLGRTNGSITLAVTATTPEAHTTHGSFEVSSVAMAQIVRSAAKLNLQVVAQVHTHPGDAFHSQGDEEGARNKYNGYVSIVLPNYGRNLPSLEGAAIYIYQDNQGFIQLHLDEVTIAPEIVS
jgi:proteasome lid subunit RPN8/RPN11